MRNFSFHLSHLWIPVLTTCRISKRKIGIASGNIHTFQSICPKGLQIYFSSPNRQMAFPSFWSMESGTIREQKPEGKNSIWKPSDKDYRRYRCQPPVRLCGYSDELIGNVFDLHKLTGKEKEAERNQLIAQGNSCAKQPGFPVYPEGTDDISSIIFIHT